MANLARLRPSSELTSSPAVMLPPYSTGAIDAGAENVGDVVLWPRRRARRRSCGLLAAACLIGMGWLLTLLPATATNRPPVTAAPVARPGRFWPGWYSGVIGPSDRLLDETAGGQCGALLGACRGRVQAAVVA